MIKADELTKNYLMYPESLPGLFHMLTGGDRCVLRKALDGVSFEVKSGETLGLIGVNGSGKTTLLKVLAGILLADSGSCTLSGRVSTLLSLGCGFHVDVSIRENIFLLMGYYGMTRGAIKAHYDSILNFAELEEYSSLPLNTLSAGMRMRLAFSCAVHVHPDVYIIDEVFSVGDIRFQQKCINKLKEHKNVGGTTIIASHDLNAIKVICDNVMLLHNGRIESFGHPEDVVNAYNQILALPPVLNNIDNTPRQTPGEEGGGSIVLLNAHLVDENKSKKVLFNVGERAIIRITTEATCDLENVTIGFVIRDYLGRDMYGTNTHYLSRKVSVKMGHVYEHHFVIAKLNLAPGDYTVTVACHDGSAHSDGHRFWFDSAITFSVVKTKGCPFVGCVHMDVDFQNDTALSS